MLTLKGIFIGVTDISMNEQSFQNEQDRYWYGHRMNLYLHLTIHG